MSRAITSDRNALSKAATIATAAVILVVVGVLLAFSTQSGQAGTSPSQSVRATERMFFLTQQEWGFNQTKGGPAIIVNQGDKVILQVGNVGQVPHDIAIVNSDGKVLWNAKSRDLQQPGSKARIEFTAQDTGTYRLVCTVPGHSQLGMEAQFLVQSG